MMSAAMTAATYPAEFRAAGTDLSERRRSGVSRGPLIDLAASPDMTGIDWAADGGLRIGAFTTIAAIAADSRIAQAYPGLAAAAQGLATPQIRQLATLGGNLAQRSRCWYFRNPHIACLKKGGNECPARTGNHLYGVAFDLGPCVAPHPSTMAMALFAEDDYEEVAARLAGTLGSWGCWDARWGPPTSGGITRARERLGFEPLRDIFAQVAVPVADQLTRGAFLGPWRLMSIDGKE